jgi:hypothetical protein
MVREDRPSTDSFSECLSSKASRADATLKKEREDKQDTALYDVFLKMDTDPAAARMEYARLRSEGLFSRASDLINWDTKINAATKREASAEQQDHEVTFSKVFIPVRFIHSR